MLVYICAINILYINCWISTLVGIESVMMLNCLRLIVKVACSASLTRMADEYDRHTSAMLSVWQCLVQTSIRGGFANFVVGYGKQTITRRFAHFTTNRRRGHCRKWHFFASYTRRRYSHRFFNSLKKTSSGNPTAHPVEWEGCRGLKGICQLYSAVYIYINSYCDVLQLYIMQYM